MADGYPDEPTPTRTTPGGLAEPEFNAQSGALERTHAAALARQVAAEHAMLRSIIHGILVAIPIAIVVCIGLLAAAISDKQSWYIWVGLGVGFGIYAAVFFGIVAGVMVSAHLLDDVDTDAGHAP